MDQQHPVLDLLLKNARYSVDEISRQTDLITDEVEEAMDALEAEGVIRSYQVVVDWRTLDDG